MVDETPKEGASAFDIDSETAESEIEIIDRDP